MLFFYKHYQPYYITMKRRLAYRNLLTKAGSILALGAAFSLGACHRQQMPGSGPEEIITQARDALPASAYKAEGQMIRQALLSISSSSHRPDEGEMRGWLEDVGYAVETVLREGSLQDAIYLFRVMERDYPDFRAALRKRGTAPLPALLDPLYPAAEYEGRLHQRLGAIFLLLPEMPDIIHGFDPSDMRARFLAFFISGFGEDGQTRGFSQRSAEALWTYMNGSEPFSEQSLRSLLKVMRDSLT